MIAASGAGIPQANEEFYGSEHSLALNHILLPLTAPGSQNPAGRRRIAGEWGMGNEEWAVEGAPAAGSGLCKKLR